MVHGQAIVVCRWREDDKAGVTLEKLLSLFRLLFKTKQQFARHMWIFFFLFIYATDCVEWLQSDIRILSEELSVWAGELDTLLLRWDDG